MEASLLRFRVLRQRYLLRVHVKAAAALAAVAAALWLAAGAAPSPTVERAAGPRLVAQNVHFRRTSIGGLVFFGELLNRGPGTAANVGVQVSVYNKGGQRLARGVTLRISGNVLPRGAKAVWVAEMTD